MTLPIKRQIDDVGCDQARELLGLAPDVDSDKCRRAALALLDEAGYEPSASWHDAVEILFTLESEQQSAGSRTSRPALRDAVEASLSGEIEAFAGGFFTFEPGERTRLWNALRKRARFSVRLSRRMEMLEPGLDIVAPSVELLEPDRQSQLVRCVLTIFPLRPAARSANWIVARDAMRDSPREWEVAADNLVRADPKVAALVPDLIAECRSFTSQLRTLARQKKSRRREAREQRWKRWRSVIKATPVWMILLVVSLGARFIATMGHVGSPSSSNRPSLLLPDMKNASEFLERKTIEQTSHAPRLEPVAESDGHRSPATPTELQIKNRIKAMSLIREYQKRNELKSRADSSQGDESRPQVAQPSDTEHSESAPLTEEALSPSDGSEP